MHVLAIMGIDSPENRKKALSVIKSNRKSPIILFLQSGDRKLHKKIEKYKKKHPRAIIQKFE